MLISGPVLTPTVTVTSDPVSPIQPVGSDVTLTCVAELSGEPEIPVTVNFELSGPVGSPLITTTPSMSSSTYTSTAMVRSFGRGQSGDYICTGTVSSTSSFIRSSMGSMSIRVTVGKAKCMNYFVC